MGVATQAQLESFYVADRFVDRDALSIHRGGESHAIEPRAYEVLRFLAERPGKLVTIDELMDAHWKGVVVTPNAVTRIIAQLRKALDDDAKHPQYIETVARTGYRLIAAVRPAGRSPAHRHALFGAAAAAVIVALAWFLLSQEPRETSVAVLPFENFTGDASLEYIGDGVAEEIINTLVKIPQLNVSARSLSFRFKSADADASDFARGLDVAYFVEGSVRQSGQKLRFTAQLIDVESGYHLWSHSADYDRLALFDGQDAISKDLSGALTEELGIAYQADPGVAGDRPDPEAYDLYLRGRQIWHRRGSAPYEQAVASFSEAVKIDPNFARGWAALASAYLSWPSYSPQGYATWSEAEAAARKALEFDPDLAEPYGVLGTFAEVRRQWHEAHRLYAEGANKNTSNATAQFWYAEHLHQIGWINESLVYLNKALELDPLYLPPRADIAWTYLLFGDTATAAQVFRDLWERGFHGMEGWVGNYISAIVSGNTDDALEWIEVSPVPDETKAVYRRFVALESGRTADPSFVDEMTLPPGIGLHHRDILWMSSRLERFDATFDYAKSRIERGLWLDVAPLWGPGTKTREQRGLGEILELLGLVQFWDDVGWGDICRRESQKIICDARDVDLSLLTPLRTSSDR